MNDKVDITKISGKKLYEECTKGRDRFLQRARYAAALTIPSLYPPEGAPEDADYQNPYQSEGAKGVNNISNKMVLGLFPPNNTFFKMNLKPETLQKMGRTNNDVKPEMSLIERIFIDDMEESGLRPKLVYMNQLLLVGGSAVLHIPNEGDPEVFRLDCFGVRRDSKGNVTKMCIKEGINITALDPILRNKLDESKIDEDKLKGKKDLTIYTCIIRSKENKMVVWKEIEGTAIKETRAESKPEDCEYIFVPFVDRGGNFGRSYLEDYIGDLQSYEGLRQSLLEGAAEASRIIYLLRPNSVISIEDVQNARSGDVLMGEPDSLSIAQNNNSINLQTVSVEAENIKRSLGAIFLLDSSVRRNAERVTAEELRIVSQELEVALGGIYSTLSNKVQKPMVRAYMNRGIKRGDVPSELRDVLKADIITGSAALGRGSEFQSINTLLTTLQQQLGPENYMMYVKPREIVSRLAYSLGVDVNDLIKTQEELEMEQQQQMLQQQQMMMAEAEAPAAVEAAYNNNGV